MPDRMARFQIVDCPSPESQSGLQEMFEEKLELYKSVDPETLSDHEQLHMLIRAHMCQEGLKLAKQGKMVLESWMVKRQEQGDNEKGDADGK